MCSGVRRTVRSAWLAALLPLWLAAAASPASGPADTQPQVLLLGIKGGIGPATGDYLQRGLRRAAEQGAEAVVLRIDTPGGLDAATRDINQAILASDVPVIAWVAPEGARAASAGTYILYACHLAAMAPATSLGAATPVGLGGIGNAPAREDEDGKSDASDDDEAQKPTAKKKPAPSGEAMARKAVNDAAAYLRGLAELRGRDTGFAQDAVLEAATLTANQALERGVIELLADDLDALLQAADGREVRLHGGSRTLRTTHAAILEVEPDWRNRLLSVITEPSIAYLLLLIGLYGLVFEGYSPGAIVPGVVGAICLLLALYALQVLPVNYAGVALIVLGVALMSTEVMLPSFGALGIGGLVALAFGSIILFDADVPGFGVPGQLVVGIGAGSGLLFMGAIWLALQSRRRPVLTGDQELLGQIAMASEDFDGHGHVLIRGESWQAECEAPLRRGQRVRVQAVDGLRLRVVPAEDSPRRAPT